MTTTRLTFTRTAAGGFDLSDGALGPIVAALRDRGLGVGARLPAAVIDAAAAELIGRARKITMTRDLDFAAATALVIADRPDLVFVARCEKARGDLDVAIAGEDAG